MLYNALNDSYNLNWVSGESELDVVIDPDGNVSYFYEDLVGEGKRYTEEGNSTETIITYTSPKCDVLNIIDCLGEMFKNEPA